VPYKTSFFDTEPIVVFVDFRVDVMREGGMTVRTCGIKIRSKSVQNFLLNVIPRPRDSSAALTNLGVGIAGL